MDGWDRVQGYAVEFSAYVGGVVDPPHGRVVPPDWIFVEIRPGRYSPCPTCFRTISVWRVYKAGLSL